MYGAFGSAEFASTQFLATGGGKKIACAGDPSIHGGVILNSNQDDDALTADSDLVALNGAQHSCPIEGHGITSITAITVKSYHNGKLILTQGAVAECGAKINPPNRKVFVE